MTKMKSMTRDRIVVSHASERGAISIYCLVIAMLAILVTLSVSSESIDELRRSRAMSDGTAALAIAEAGADYTIAQLRQSSTYAGTGGAVTLGKGNFSTSVTTSGTGDKVIDSTGTLPNGVYRKVEVVISSAGSSTSIFPDGAFISNGNVSINGNACTLTSPSTQHVANVKANGNITTVGNASIDGAAVAAGSLNTNGRYVTSLAGAPRISFPDAATIAAMQQSLINQAKAGRTISSVSVSKTTTTIASPVYIDGNVSLSSKSKLVFTGPGPVYIAGSLTLTGQSEVDNSAVLAVRDNIDAAGQGTYVATGAFNTCAMFSFSNDQSSAIKISGNASNVQMGIIYAVNGGVQINGNGSVYGAVIAGGSSSSSSIVGNGNILYPVGLTTSNVNLPKAASKVTSWLEF